MFLLDTNVISELRKAGSGRIDPNVSAWIADKDASQLYISLITVMELEVGIGLLERRNAIQGRVLRQWLETRVLTEFSERMLAVDVSVVRCAAGFHIPDRRPDRDAFIAATALVHAMSVVTRNVVDFAPTGASVVNPWVPGISV